MANGAKLAMDFIEKNAHISNNITIVIKDTAGDSSIAASKASEAIAEGASLILGPLRGQNVQAVGEIAKMANIPVIGFSNNSNAASAGVYLLNVLPQSEVRRSLKYAASLGHSSFVSIAPTSSFGQIQQNAFIQETTKLGLNASGTYSFNSESEARNAIQTIIPLIKEGQVSAIFIPDRATAPSFGVLLEAAGIDRSKILLIGSADWENDLNISQTPYLNGAIFPAIDDRGQQAIKPDYLARFGSKPHPFTTIAYTATLLANSKSLSKSSPAFSRASLTNTAGFNGRDGLFRFLVDGKSEYALIMKSVTNGGSVRVDGPKLP
jgi:ABC-type branched-subunit amino acid transport system substrate-binding protein